MSVHQTCHTAKTECHPVIAIYCMAHTLLGFIKYGMENLINLQRSVIANDGIKLGRDAYNAFSFSKSENAVVRAVRTTCEIVRPNGDERHGIRNKWMADCDRHGQRSFIGDYRAITGKDYRYTIYYYYISNNKN